MKRLSNSELIAEADAMKCYKCLNLAEQLAIELARRLKESDAALGLAKAERLELLSAGLVVAKEDVARPIGDGDYQCPFCRRSATGTDQVEHKDVCPVSVFERIAAKERQ